MFWFQLSVIMGTTVKRLQQEMDSREFGEWIAYNRICPLEPVRSDLRSAAEQALLANINRDKKRKHSPYELEDFRLNFDPSNRERRKSWQEIKGKLMGWKGMLDKTQEKEKSRKKRKLKKR